MCSPNDVTIYLYILLVTSSELPGGSWVVQLCSQPSSPPSPEPPPGFYRCSGGSSGGGGEDGSPCISASGSSSVYTSTVMSLDIHWYLPPLDLWGIGLTDTLDRTASSLTLFHSLFMQRTNIYWPDSLLASVWQWKPMGPFRAYVRSFPSAHAKPIWHKRSVNPALLIAIRYCWFYLQNQRSNIF